MFIAWHEVFDDYDTVSRHAGMVARAQIDNDLLQRRWAASHGGVYVPVDATTPPSPYLNHIPERDIETPSGRKLTLINPAYMMRQVNELADTQSGIKRHITSLKPLRPENKPDPWEAAALQSIEQGQPSVQAVSDLDGVSYLRTLYPFIVEKKCLKCHAGQGYKVGDIRGGISVSVPIAPYLKEFRAALSMQIAYHGGVWLLGLLGLFLFRTKMQQQLQKTASSLEESLRIAEELKNSQARFQSLSDASFGGVIIHEQGLILDCNQGLADMTGFTLDELIGMDGRDLIEPDALPLVLKNIKSGYGDRYEVEGVRKDGSIYPLSIKGKNVQYQGREVRVIEFRDITERKKAEASLRKNEAMQRAMLENIGDVIAIVDAKGFNRFKSGNVERWFGWSPQELVGRLAWENIHPDDLSRIRKAFSELVPQENTTKTEECRYRCKDGSYKWIEVTGTNCLHDPDIRGILLNYHDITEKLEHEKEQQGLEKLESLGILAGGLAHDFNNLLAGLYGNVSLVKMHMANDHPASRYVEAIEKSMNSAKLLTNQFLIFAKGGDPLPEQLDLQDLIREIIGFNLAGSNVKLDMSPVEDLWLVNVDQGQIEQVFANLTINAKQAMPSGGQLAIRLKNICIAAETISDMQAGRYVQVMVTDTGYGIAPDLLEKVFDPYFSTKVTGSGLGLATVHSIIKRHGGHILIDSQLNTGTSFTLYLPAIEKAVKFSQPEEVTLSDSIAAKVLVLDDEEVVRKTLSALLELLGCRVESVINSQQAIGSYRAAMESGDPFDVAIFDLTIPGEEGGKETAQQILQIDPGARLIISSGYAADDVMASYQDYGFKGVVKKPYLIEGLKIELQRVLRVI